MDYPLAMNYIEEKNKLGITPGLDNIKELLNRLGNPQDSCKCLHIAGTNGKGSIFAFLQDILMETGMRVGRYVSPTIMTYLERFQINREYMKEETFACYVEQVKQTVDAMIADGMISPSAFEIETAIAFMYFRDQQVDVALIECGMGGELDATNVIHKPLASVFASISMDHMAFLGDTVEEIARNKSMIIKEDSLCIAHPQQERVSKVLRDRCHSQGVRYVEVNQQDIAVMQESVEGSSFSYKGENYTISMPGVYQIGNACTAIEIALQLFDVSTELINNAISNTAWAGRFMKVNDKPLTIIDGAHNERAWILLTDSINKYFTNQSIIYIIGVLKDKEYDKMVDIFKDSMSHAITITPDTPRGLDKDILKELILLHGVSAETAKTPEEAIQKAYHLAGTEGVVVICGSLSFLKEYIEYDYNRHK